MSPWLSRKRIFEIVTSGNSAWSWPRTSPIERCGPLVRRTPHVDLASGARGRAQHEGQHEPADLELVEVTERGDVDPLVVDVGAVERPGVAHLVAPVVAGDLGVAARDGDVVEEDVGVGMAPERRHRAVEDEGRALVRAPPHHQQAHPRGDLVEEGAELVLDGLAVLERREAQGGLVVVAGEGRATGGAVLGPGLVLVAATTASHRGRGYRRRSRAAMMPVRRSTRSR